MTTTSGASSRSRVLIVDDDVALLEGVESAFRAAGEDASSCSSFELARQMLRSEEFGVLITDVRLGAFNGLQLALLARDLYPQITLIVFSGFDDPVLRAEAEHAGAAYVVKPVATSTLLELARRSRPPSDRV
jgi:DNA-binding NtrC family response regulator